MLTLTDIGLPDSQSSRSSKRPRLHDPRNPSESVSPLTCGDRKKAVDLMKGICSQKGDGVNVDSVEQLHELQRMMMLNIKAEIQAVDSFGNVTAWLDEALCR